MSQHSQVSLFEVLPFSVGDSHVSRFPQPGSERAKKILDTSSRKCCALLTSQSPLGLLVRTLLTSHLLPSTKKYAYRWRVRTTKSSRFYFRLHRLERPTEEIGSSLLPTLRTVFIPETEAHWLNRRKNFIAGKSKFNPHLPLLVVLGRIKAGMSPSKSFANWMMGFPPEWIDGCESSETA